TTLTLSPTHQPIPAGGSQTYAAEGFDTYGNDAGDVTSSTTFTIDDPHGSCTGADCTGTTAGAHTVTGTDGGATGTASLTVTAGPLDHLVLSPASATITAGGSQAYTAEGFDQYGNDLGDETAATIFGLDDGTGSCTLNTCTATKAGPHTVAGDDAGALGPAPSAASPVPPPACRSPPPLPPAA